MNAKKPLNINMMFKGFFGIGLDKMTDNRNIVKRIF